MLVILNKVKNLIINNKDCRVFPPRYDSVLLSCKVWQTLLV